VSHIEIHPWTTELEKAAKAVELSCKKAVEEHAPVLKEIHTETRIEPVFKSELPGKGRVGQCLMVDQDGCLSWMDLPKTDLSDVEKVKRNLTELVDVVADHVQTIATLKAQIEMNNYEKEQLISQLKDYWLDAHEDCFTETADGRKIFRNELLTYKHDVALRKLSAQGPTEKEVRTVVKDPDKRVWFALAAVVIIQIVTLLAMVHK